MRAVGGMREGEGSRRWEGARGSARCVGEMVGVRMAWRANGAASKGEERGLTCVSNERVIS